MKTYELTYIISPELSSEEAESKSKDIETAIQQNEGIITSKTVPSPKPLAFPVGGHASGFFGIIKFESEPEKLPLIEDVVKKDKKITRHIVLVKKAVKIKKDRRASRGKTAEAPIAPEKHSSEAVEPKEEEKKEKPKVELKDIEERLDEILGE